MRPRRLPPDQGDSFARGALTALRLAEQRLVGSLRSFAQLQKLRLEELTKAEDFARYACELSPVYADRAPAPGSSIDRIANLRGEHYRDAIDALARV